MILMLADCSCWSGGLRLPAGEAPVRVSIGEHGADDLPVGVRSAHRRVPRLPRVKTERLPEGLHGNTVLPAAGIVVLSTPLSSKRSTAGTPLSPGRCRGFACPDQPAQLSSSAPCGNQVTTADWRIRARVLRFVVGTVLMMSWVTSCGRADAATSARASLRRQGRGAARPPTSRPRL